MTDPRTALVAAGYDAMSDIREAELGCGGATEETRALAERFRFTAVDLSAGRLRRAGAVFVHGDVTEPELQPGSVDALAALAGLAPEGEATSYRVPATR